MTPYYADDSVTIYHGDCREILPSITADVLVTDPPTRFLWYLRGLVVALRVQRMGYNSDYRGEAGIAYNAARGPSSCSPRAADRSASTEVSP